MIRDCPFSENVSKRYLKSNHLSMLQLNSNSSSAETKSDATLFLYDYFLSFFDAFSFVTIRAQLS